MTDRIVDRVDRPLPGLFALGLAAPGQHEVLLISTGSPRRRRATWALVADRPRGAPADASVRALRERLVGGRVVAMLEDRGIVLVVARGAQRLWVTADAAEGLVVSDALDGAVPLGDAVDDAELDRARARGAKFVEAHQEGLADGARDAASAAIAKARERLTRRIVAIRGDQRAVDVAEAQAERARLFVAAAARAPRGVTALEATDYTTGEPRAVSLEVSPDRSARAQLDALFTRAKRLRAGRRVADARLAEAERAIVALDDASRALAGVQSADAAFALLATASRALPGDLARARPSRVLASRGREIALPKGVRAFVAGTGATILVGRDADANDALTVRLARPGDLWLHARGVTGAHVVAPGWYRSGRLDAETLVDAATLAAHFSDARGEAIVDVSYTDRRFVKKARRAPAGAVTLLDERVLALRLEEPRLARLLASG